MKEDFFKKYKKYKSKYIYLKNITNFNNFISDSKNKSLKLQTFNLFNNLQFGGNTDKFEPEIEPKEIPYNKEIWEKLFPKEDGVDFKKLKLTNIAEYSVSRPTSAQFITDIIKSYYKDLSKLTITDATANVGGNTINFAKHFKKVNAVEIVPIHCEFLKNNLEQYKLLDKVNINCNDYMNVYNTFSQDIVYFDPPWGGPDYYKEQQLDLFINNKNIYYLINSLYQRQVKFVVIKVPKNFNISRIIKETLYKNVDIHKVLSYKGNIRYLCIVFHNYIAYNL